MAFEGVYSIIPTAFTDSGDLDAASQRRVVDLFINRGANGLTVLGVTGEVARLEEHERREVLETVVKQAKEIGAAAVIVSPPRMPKLNSKATTASLDRVLAWVTAQKGMEWISV